jgi:uncharacterized membrane protein HdeD (DUF308 family)
MVIVQGTLAIVQGTFSQRLRNIRHRPDNIWQSSRQHLAIFQGTLAIVQGTFGIVQTTFGHPPNNIWPSFRER